MLYLLIVLGATIGVTAVCAAILALRFTPRKPRLPHDLREARHEEARLVAEAFLRHNRRGGGWWRS